MPQRTARENEWIIFTCSSMRNRIGALYLCTMPGQPMVWSKNIDDAFGYTLKRDASKFSGDYAVMRRSDVRKLPV